LRLFAGIRNSVESEKNADGRLLVIFDGHCALCSRTVRWLIKRDRRDRLRFAASESRRGLGMLRKQAEEGSSIFVPPATILVLRHAGTAAEQLLKRSDAIVSLLGELPGPWPAVGTVLGLIPRTLRDLGYRVVARWRYRIWGRLESCPLPTGKERSRFL